VASTAARAAILDSDGTVVRELDLPASRAGEAQLLAALPSGCIVVLESTGRYHLRWARRLTAAGHRVHVVNALLAKRLATDRNALRGNKSDPIDARHLARLGLMHLPTLESCLFREDPARKRLLELCRVRSSQRAVLTQCLSLAHHYLYGMLPEAEALGVRFAQNRAAVELFLEIDSLARLRAMRRTTLEKHLADKAEPFARMLRESPEIDVVFDACLPALQAQLRLVASLGNLLDEMLVQIRAAIKTSGQKQLVDLALTIPGFGQKTAPAIIACLPDTWEQWGDKRTTAIKLQAFFGFDPRLRTSGKWAGKVRMTKRGIALARTALYQAAFCALRTDPDLRAAYHAQRAAGKHHDVAVSHLMRRQLRRLVAVLKDRSPFVVYQSPEVAVPA
jgi:transposase